MIHSPQQRMGLFMFFELCDVVRPQYVNQNRGNKGLRRSNLGQVS
jgi:hypothetical protein